MVLSLQGWTNEQFTYLHTRQHVWCTLISKISHENVYSLKIWCATELLQDERAKRRIAEFERNLQIVQELSVIVYQMSKSCRFETNETHERCIAVWNNGYKPKKNTLNTCMQYLNKRSFIIIFIHLDVLSILGWYQTKHTRLHLFSIFVHFHIYSNLFSHYL